jgi:hypothetical protein
MADKTERRLTRDLMLEAVPCARYVRLSQISFFHFFQPVISYVFFSQHLCGAGNLIFGSWTLLEISLCRSAGDIRIINEIMEVPFPLAASRRLMSFLTFHISMFFSASLA